jgi:hypothetical protein
MTLDQKIQVFIGVGTWFAAVATVLAVVVALRLAGRVEREAKREQIRRFNELQKLTPNLFRQMAEALRGDATGIREIVILEGPGTPFEAGKPRFAYYKSDPDHPNLLNHVDGLREAGYLEDLTVDRSAPIYKMLDPFVRLLKEHA